MRRRARLAGDELRRPREARAGQARGFAASPRARPPLPPAGRAAPRSRAAERLPLADRDWISATCTRTRPGRTTARRGRRAARPRGGEGPRRDRRHRPQRLRRRARGGRAGSRTAKLIVIPGEEVKTDGQGEVIGLFLREEIPRGMSFADTIAAIRAQGGLVYLPHPFDRRHAIPDPATLHRHLAEIDVFEVYNARLLFETYNDEALRFARKYNLTMGAGSDAHVLPGRRHRRVRMRAFRTPEEFLISLRSGRGPAPAEVARLPPVASSGWRRSRKRSARGEQGPRSPWRCRPTRSTRSTCRRRSPRSTISADEIARAAGERAPVLGSGHPARRRHAAQVRAAGVGDPGGRRLLRPRRPGDPEVAAAAARRPDGRLRDELPQVRRRRARRARAGVADARAAHRPAEARRRHGRATRSAS